MLAQSVLICVLALAPALGTAFFHPRKPAWRPEPLRRDEVFLITVRKWTREVLWLDARSRQDYDRGHIPLAKLLNEDEWSALLATVVDAWNPGQPVVVYCDDRLCQSSRRVAERLRKAGVRPVYILIGGWKAWQASPK